MATGLLQIERVSAQIVVIGGGVGGLGLAAEAIKMGIKVIILDKGLNNTTSAATGIFDARPDHLLKDAESVKVTAEEVIKWRELLWLFPDLIKPTMFHLLLNDSAPHGAEKFQVLLNYYNEVARQRSWGLPEKPVEISRIELEQFEPNLRKNYFRSAFRFWLWTVNAGDFSESLVKQFQLTNRDDFRIEYISKIVGYELQDRIIKEIVVEKKKGGIVKISNYSRPLIVVNAAGPWLNEPLKELGVKLPVYLQLGIQAKISGNYFKSGLIFFADNEAPRGKPRGILSGILPKPSCCVASYFAEQRNTLLRSARGRASEGLFSLSPSSSQQVAGYSAKENKKRQCSTGDGDITMTVYFFILSETKV